MKKIIFVVLAMVFVYATSPAQGKVPKSVETAFNVKFPKAIKVKWEKENKHEYEANFMQNGLNYSANFSDLGEWFETESLITFDELPLKIQTVFNSNHKEEKIKAVAKIETSKGDTQYEIEIKKGLKTVEYIYNSIGELIK
jgi:hypothetical protein